MGSTIGYVLIPTAKKIDFNDLINNVFSKYNLNINESELNDNNFNLRSPNYISFIETKDLVAVSNIPYAMSFFKKNNEGDFLKLYEYFNKPELIFVLLKHDNPSDYGYSVIKNGKLERSYLSLEAGFKISSFGEPYDFENNWLNGIRKSEVDINGEQVSTLTNTKTKEKKYLDELDDVLSSEAVKYFLNVSKDEICFGNHTNYYYKLYEKTKFPIAKILYKIKRLLSEKPLQFIFYLGLIIILMQFLRVFLVIFFN